MIRKIDRDGGVKWQVYGRKIVDGKSKQRYVGTFESERAAREAEQDDEVTQRKIRKGELPADLDDRRTLDQAADDWLDSLKAVGSRSHRAYTDRMRIYVRKKLGATPIARITKSHIMRLRDELGRQFSPANANSVKTCLSSFFTYCVDRQWIAENPCRGVKPIETPDRLYVWIRTREDITKFLLECPKGIREMSTVALLTGMRIDELLHLRWADIDLEHRLITVHRGRQGTTKSGKVRRVPVLDALLPLLRELALNRAGETLIFPGAKGKPRTKVGVRVPFKQAVERAGLDTALRFHDLRHTFASHWVMNGGDVFRLSKILGHSDVRITQKTYAHLSPEVWVQDYERVSFVVPEADAAYGKTKNPIRLRLASV